MQEPSGAIPWTPGEHTDVWNHVEAAMALMVGGQREAAERAYAWVRDDPAPRRLVADEDRRRRGRGPLRRDQHVGLRRGRRCGTTGWSRATRRSSAGCGRPCGGRSTSWSSLQLPFGGVAWSQEWHDGAPATVNEDALLAGSSSIYHTLRAGVALAELVGEPQVEWELAGGRLGHALREHRDLFLDKSTFSMDWYYPVLGGAVRGDGRPRAARRALGHLRRARPRHPLRLRPTRG